MDVKAHVRELGQKACEASRALARASTELKNQALLAMAAQIRSKEPEILRANAQDVSKAKE